MAAPKLTEEQRVQILEWLVADYSSGLILNWIKIRREREENPEPWPAELSRAALTYYRNKWRAEIETARKERQKSALMTGLALKEERVARLKQHADELEAIKWMPDKNGRLWNEKAWREVLDDIAKEMGHRRQGVDLSFELELEAFLDRLRDNLDEATYARVLALAAGSEAD